MPHDQNRAELHEGRVLPEPMLIFVSRLKKRGGEKDRTDCDSSPIR